MAKQQHTIDSVTQRIRSAKRLQLLGIEKASTGCKMYFEARQALVQAMVAQNRAEEAIEQGRRTQHQATDQLRYWQRKLAALPAEVHELIEICDETESEFHSLRKLWTNDSLPAHLEDRFATLEEIHLALHCDEALFLTKKKSGLCNLRSSAGQVYVVPDWACRPAIERRVSP